MTRHRVDELHRVAQLGQPPRVDAGPAADVENPEPARRKMTLDDLARAYELELVEPFDDALRLVEVLLVIDADLVGTPLVHRKSVRTAAPASVAITLCACPTARSTSSARWNRR